ncbi:hypothetical protein RFI_17553 [Reticulomyxa filosa]|uniref:Uncharacterized protein n=1 Tax=Reticulomyxa filosa TaxID=46433 RepID=X6N1R5_RETFI|nr:hypothetical protein RFI_17553 [Reticulomyxa filosa]|eukprot:ETO19679.1 hypothetical protein RFI_17553 [Reticulomyxa filosa]
MYDLLFFKNVLFLKSKFKKICKTTSAICCSSGTGKKDFNKRWAKLQVCKTKKLKNIRFNYNGATDYDAMKKLFHYIVFVDRRQSINNMCHLCKQNFDIYSKTLNLQDEIQKTSFCHLKKKFNKKLFYVVHLNNINYEVIIFLYTLECKLKLTRKTALYIVIDFLKKYLRCVVFKYHFGFVIYFLVQYILIFDFLIIFIFFK